MTLDQSKGGGPVVQGVQVLGLHAMDWVRLSDKPDAHALFHRCRDVSPIYPGPTAGSWVVIAYHPILEVLRNPVHFNSDLNRNRPTVWERDGDVHTILRQVARRAFSRERLTEIADVMVHRVDKICAGFERERVDVIQDFSRPVALNAMKCAMGLSGMSDEVLEIWASSDWPEESKRCAESHPIVPFVSEWVRSQSGGFAAELLESLPTQTSCTFTFSAEHALCVLRSLIYSASHTTTHLIGNVLNVLSRRPDLWETLKFDRNEIAGIVQETLRFDCPAYCVARRAAIATTIAGQSISKGDLIHLVLFAGNRDPAGFRSPDHFDPQRTNNSHLAFGFGIHACIGAQLARMLAEIAIGSLVNRFQHVDALPGSIRLRSPEIRGFRRLPMRFRV